MTGKESTESGEGGPSRLPSGRRLTRPEYNRSLVCATLFHEGPESRLGLHHATGIPLSRLSEACGDLLRAGLIRESIVTPPEGNGRGRPQTLLEIELRGLGAACVGYDHDHVVAAVADLAGTVRWRRRWAGPFSAEEMLGRIARAGRLAVAAAVKAGVEVVAVGAADPGTVDTATGRSVRAVSMPGWRNAPVAETLRKATGLPALIDRGDGWQALGEAAFGAGRGVSHAVFVTLLEGIGGGIVENGRLVAGRDGSAGEIGHTRVSEDGPRCRCGGLGCLEAHLAPSRLTFLWRNVGSQRTRNQAAGAAPIGEPTDQFSRLLDAAKGGDVRARAVLAEAARALARGLGNVISLLNPETIILGGRFIDAGETILDPLRRRLPDYALPELLQGVEVRLAELGETSAFLGVAAHVRDRFFAYPSSGAGLVGGGSKASIPVSSEDRP